MGAFFASSGTMRYIRLTSPGFLVHKPDHRQTLFRALLDPYQMYAQAVELFAYLIESACLAGIITGEAQPLAYLWLANNHQCREH